MKASHYCGPLVQFELLQKLERHSYLHQVADVAMLLLLCKCQVSSLSNHNLSIT